MIINLHGFACLKVWAMGKMTVHSLFSVCNSPKYLSQSVSSGGFFLPCTSFYAAVVLIQMNLFPFVEFSFQYENSCISQTSNKLVQYLQFF